MRSVVGLGSLYLKRSTVKNTNAFFAGLSWSLSVTIRLVYASLSQLTQLQYNLMEELHKYIEIFTFLS